MGVRGPFAPLNPDETQSLCKLTYQRSSKVCSPGQFTSFTLGCLFIGKGLRPTFKQRGPTSWLPRWGQEDLEDGWRHSQPRSIPSAGQPSLNPPLPLQNPLSSDNASSLCSTVDYKPPQPEEEEVAEEAEDSNEPEECFTEGEGPSRAGDPVETGRWVWRRGHCQ